MNIAFATDENYVGPLAVSLNSLLRHTGGTIRVYIIDDGITEQSWEKLSEIISGPDRTLIRLTVPKERFHGIKISGCISSWITESTLSRIVLPELVSDLDRIVYLDCDLLIRKDLRSLYDSNLGTHIVGAVEDPGFDGFHRLGTQRADRYFNAGVLLIDISAWNRITMTNTVLRHLREYPESATWFDQCHLNACLTRQWHMLHPRWNVQMQMLKGAAMRIPQNSREIIEARLNPAIVHFTSDQKPWLRGAVHPYTNAFKKELALTPFLHWKPVKDSGQWWKKFTPKASVQRAQFLFTLLSDTITRFFKPPAVSPL